MSDVYARLGKAIREQDNRGTRNPVFIVEREERIHIGEDVDWHAPHEWLETDDGIRVDDEVQVKLLDAYWKVHEESPEGYLRSCYHSTWNFETFCFTRAGCEAYIERNSHRWRSASRIEDQLTHRNTELSELRDALIASGREPERAE